MTPTQLKPVLTAVFKHRWPQCYATVASMHSRVLAQDGDAQSIDTVLLLLLLQHSIAELDRIEQAHVAAGRAHVDQLAAAACAQPTPTTVH